MPDIGIELTVAQRVHARAGRYGYVDDDEPGVVRGHRIVQGGRQHAVVRVEEQHHAEGADDRDGELGYRSSLRFNQQCRERCEDRAECEWKGRSRFFSPCWRLTTSWQQQQSRYRTQ